MRAEGGHTNSGLVLLLAAVMLCLGIAQSPFGGTWGGHAATALVIAGALVLAYRSGALPRIDTEARATVAENIARQLNAELSSAQVAVWGGGTETEYRVKWRAQRCPITLTLGVAGVSLDGDMTGAGASRCTVSVKGGAFDMTGEGAARVESLLDNGMRTALAAIDALAKGKASLSLNVGSDAVVIYLQQALDTSRTHEFIDNGVPVIENIVAALAPGRA